MHTNPSNNWCEHLSLCIQMHPVVSAPLVSTTLPISHKPNVVAGVTTASNTHAQIETCVVRTDRKWLNFAHASCTRCWARTWPHIIKSRRYFSAQICVNILFGKHIHLFTGDILGRMPIIAHWQYMFCKFCFFYAHRVVVPTLASSSHKISTMWRRLTKFR